MATLMTQDPGEKSLSRLLNRLTATLHPATFVFTLFDDEEKLPPLAHVVHFFREREGITVITSLEYAEAHSIQYLFPCKMITLDVTSSLEAVGFIAVVATRLAARDLGVNPVSGFYHDHLFVPLGREDDAMETLGALSDEMRGASTS